MRFKRKNDWNALETRTYRFKKVAFEFFCPLCRTKRAITTNHRLTILNYLQITLLTGITMAALWPWAGIRGALSFFPYWVLFEGARRILFSREIPCPHCGFDASWYKRDVKVAKRIVGEFWQDREDLVMPPQGDQVENSASSMEA